MFSRIIAILLLVISTNVIAADQQPEKEQVVKTNATSAQYPPLIERYILDELKSIRQDQQAFRAEVENKVANARLDVSDRAIR